MRIRRKGRPRTSGSWTPEKSAQAHAAKARKRMESDPPCYMNRVPENQHLGTLQWHDSSGTVRQWVITQGPRANNIKVHAKGKAIVCGWDFMMRKLRKHLSVPKRLIS